MTGFDARLLDAFDSAAIDHALWPTAIALALLVGAAHALRPGHGKTLVAAYLVAEQGRWMHAAALAVIVAGLHTVSVLAIGLLWWAVAGERAGSIEPLAVWGRLAVALMVFALGAVVLRRQWRAFQHRRSHHHDHGPAEGVAPWSWAGLFGIASAGALIPSPAAFLLLVSGLLTGQAALAVAMVACFGIGLAATVLAVGLMVIAGRDWLGRKAKTHRPLARLGAVTPLLGAAAIVCGGFVLSAAALAALVGS